MEGKEIIEKCQNEIAVKHGYDDWFQIDMTEDSECEKNEVKQRLMIEVAELCVSQLQQELEKAKELIARSHGLLLLNHLRKVDDLLPNENTAESVLMEELSTFLEGSGNKTK